MKNKQKVWIRGVEGRGEEVLNALKAVGGKLRNGSANTGDVPYVIYTIDHKGYIGGAEIISETAKIIMDCYREIKLPEKWMDGDVLVDNRDSVSFLVKSNVSTGGWGKSFLKAHLFVCPHFYAESPIGVYCNAEYHKADSEEVRRFHELLHKHGKDWDDKKKELAEWPWKPQIREYYFFVNSDLSVLSTSNDGPSIELDVARIKCGNCFRTREEAEAAAERVRKLLKGGEK